MDVIDGINRYENGQMDEEEQVEFFQHLVSTGTAWHLQGHYARTAHWMIQEGLTDKQFTFFETEDEFMNKAAIAPRSNCVLDTTKAEKAGIGMRPVEEAMIDSIRKMLQSVIS